MNRIEYSSDNHEEIIRMIRDDGYAIVENVLDQPTLDAIHNEVYPYLDDTNEDNQCAFLGEHTKRFGRLVYRIPSSHSVIRHPMTMDVCQNVIGPYSCAFQLSFTGIMHVMAGQPAQILHRDVAPFPSPSPTLVLATMWALTDFTRENGATVVVPRSHKWDKDRVPTKDELRCVEMSAGSMFFYDGMIIHGAGKCVRGERTGLNLQYKVGWLRQEENQYLATPLEVARTLPEDMQRLIGYDLAARHWGAVDQDHPLDFLNERKIVGTLEPEGYDMEGRVMELSATEVGIATRVRYDVTLDD